MPAPQHQVLIATGDTAEQPTLRRNRDASRARQENSRGIERDVHSLSKWLGSILVIGTGANNLMLWWSPQFGLAQWEFTTITQTINNLPLLLIGLTLIAVPAVREGSQRWTVVLSGTFGLLAATVLVLAIMLAFASLAGWEQMVGQDLAAPGKSLFIRAVAKSYLLIAMYVAFGTVVSVRLWKRARA